MVTARRSDNGGYVRASTIYRSHTRVIVLCTTGQFGKPLLGRSGWPSSLLGDDQRHSAEEGSSWSSKQQGSCNLE
jgi:hypothetical protein